MLKLFFVPRTYIIHITLLLGSLSRLVTQYLRRMLVSSLYLVLSLDDNLSALTTLAYEALLVRSLREGSRRNLSIA